MAEALTPTPINGLKTSSESIRREASEVSSSNSVPQTTTAVVVEASEEASAPLLDPLAKVQQFESSSHIGSSTVKHHSTAGQGSQERQGTESYKSVTGQCSSFPEEEQQSPQLPPEAHTSSLQPSTPPLSSPAGASPTSRPASVTEGEDSSSAGPSEYPPLAEVAEGIRGSNRKQAQVHAHCSEAICEDMPGVQSIVCV